MSPTVFIGTPTLNGVMASDHVASLVRMLARLQERGIGTVYRTADGPSLPVQRDMLAHMFLDTGCTHLLLVDGDMMFEAGLAEALLSAGKRLVGTVTARRAPDLARAKALASQGLDRALALACDWNVRLGGAVAVRDGLARVEALGMGFALIERACLDEMVARLDLPLYRAYHADLRLRAFFRTVPGEEAQDGTPDQDHAFCRRWRRCGGEVWAYPAARIARIGDFAFGVPFGRYLAALKAARTQEAGEAPP